MAVQSKLNFAITKPPPQTPPPGASDYPKHLAAYFAHTHAPTGRFDQKPITAQFPEPQGMTEEDALMIVVNMQASALSDPALAASILPQSATGAYMAAGMGGPWSEYENAAMIREMSLVARQLDGTQTAAAAMVDRVSVGRRNLFANMSRVLNCKYGIDRSEASCKNQWYRELRARSGIDERGCFRTAKDSSRLSENLRVSLNGKAKSKAKGRLSKSKVKTKAIKKDTESPYMTMVY